MADYLESYMSQMPMIIAEAGNAHEGNFENAKRLIEQAFECGCDAVKFQAGEAHDFARTPDKISFYEQFVLPLNDFVRLYDYGRKIGIPVFFSIWSESYESLRLIEKWHKIPARQCRKEIIEKYDSETTFVSIPYEINDIKNLGINKSIPLHCISQYPAIDTHFGRMSYLRECFGRVGFSDHYIGIQKSVFAILAGACVIEKHFTLDHNFSSFRDHKLSADIEEMKRLVEISRIYQ